MKRLFTLLTILVFCCSTVYPQVFNIGSKKSLNKSTKDWSYTIDTTWGAGLSTAQKLYFFDNWWSRVDQTWGGFPNLVINWDSLKNYYRPIIEGGVSRGRFMGIMGRLTRALSEEHAPVVDPNVDVIYGIYYDYYGSAIGYPNYPTFNYKKGIPLLNLSYQFRTCFGAGVTAYNDSIAMIYSVMPNHPLNLQPGDIILGYDGLPWKQNLEDLIDQELPLLFGTSSSSSPETFNHVSVLSAGMNWGLFDTIDILKYFTGDTLHYPTSLLSSITQPYFIATEQLPINGVPFPNLSGNNVVSWGVVEGTSIGYIHVWNWYTGNVTALFEQAVDELMHLHNVTGLILDFRVNQGGYPEYANGGFKHLFNEDPTSNFSTAQRVPGDDHYLFNIQPTGIFINHFNPTPELFDHPIAVLTGPICASAGDMNAFRMRFHPMARFFGKKTMGAFTSYDNWQNIYYSAYDYKSRVDNGCMYSNYNNEGFLIHKGSPVDEEVWLTRDGVANGQDDVVSKALEWINNVVYPHDIISDASYYSVGEDTVEISAMIENPNQHLIAARAYINNIDGEIIDSVDLTKQLLKANSENWKGNIVSPATEDFFKVSVKTFDQTVSDQFNVTNASRFTTSGPVVLDNISWSKSSTNYYVTPFIENQSSVTTITNASVRLICNDPWITSINPVSHTLQVISPGGIVGSDYPFVVTVDNSIFPGYFNFKVVVYSAGWPYWSDSMRVETTFPLNVSVVNGWNMVSIPGLHPVNQNVLTWWAGKDPLADVFKYGGVGYNAITIAAPGEGYWIKHLGANVYNTGDEWPVAGIQIVAHDPIAAASGWNLFGGYELSVATAGLTTNPPGLIIGSVYKYSGGYQVATTLDPGYGYWIKLSAAGQIIIPESLAKGTEPVEMFPEKWGKIVLTDATGINYTLYAVNGEVNPDQYELPPAPPTEMFDIRYASGRIAEDLNSDIQIIEMQGITYPITIKAEGLTITLHDETGEIVNSVLVPGKELVINNSFVNKLIILSAELGNNIPTEYSLSQNYPNPFNPSTTFRYSIPTQSKVVIKIYDVLGNEVATLMDEEKSVGNYELTWDTENLSSGIYFYQLKAGNYVDTKKMILLK